MLLLPKVGRKMTVEKVSAFDYFSYGPSHSHMLYSGLLIDPRYAKIYLRIIENHPPKKLAQENQVGNNSRQRHRAQGTCGDQRGRSGRDVMLSQGEVSNIFQLYIAELKLWKNSKLSPSEVEIRKC